MSDDRVLVYSTETGRVRDDGRRKRRKKTGPARPRPTDGALRVRREKKGRGGKVVCVIEGAPEAEARAIAKRIKAALGVGGSAKGGAIVIQTAERDRLVALLVELGFPAKPAGG